MSLLTSWPNPRDNKTESELQSDPWLKGSYPVKLSYKFKGSETVWSMYFRSEESKGAYKNTFSPFVTFTEC